MLCGNLLCWWCATWGMWKGYGGGCARGVDGRRGEHLARAEKSEKRKRCKISDGILTIRRLIVFSCCLIQVISIQLCDSFVIKLIDTYLKSFKCFKFDLNCSNWRPPCGKFRFLGPQILNLRFLCYSRQRKNLFLLTWMVIYQTNAYNIKFSTLMNLKDPLNILRYSQNFASPGAEAFLVSLRRVKFATCAPRLRAGCLVTVFCP